MPTSSMLTKLFVLLLLHFPLSWHELTYDINDLVPVWTDTAEQRITWTVSDERDWMYKRGDDNDADKLGLLLTGISEFPWVVDVRVDIVNEEKWSTGNMVSFWYILTTCRAVDLMEDDDSRLNGTGIKVTFTQHYLWEYQERLKIFPDEENYAFAGSRISEIAIRHPLCSVVQNVWDVAILKLTYGIPPAAPKIGYIPVVKDYRTGAIPDDVDLSKMERQRLVCFVASIGRNYRNSKNNLAVDFKVKHRVYFEDFNECVRMIPRMCKVGFAVRNCGPQRLANPDKDGRHWMCFRTRAKVGTVCDHDRGAPLVCDGEVYGIVVMGALGENCNSLLPVQFVVAKIPQFRQYFEQFIKMEEHHETSATKATYRYGMNLVVIPLLMHTCL